jgi:tight adherence protein C
MDYSFAELWASARQPMPAVAIATGALSAALATYGIAQAPARTGSRLGPRGLKRQHALAEGDWFPMLEPLLRWFGTRLSGVVPEGLHKTLDRRLVRAGDYLGMTAEEYVVTLFAGALVGLAAGAFHSHMFEYGPASLVVGTVLGAFYAQTRFDSEIQKRGREITHGLPYVTDLLALAMTAGLDFPGAVRNVVDRSSDRRDALTEELELILHELSLGHTRKYALEQLAERTQVPSAIEFAYAVVQADERGSPLADVLSIQATVARQKRSAIAEEKSSKAQQMMMIPLMLLMASTMIVVIVPMMLKVMDTFDKLL